MADLQDVFGGNGYDTSEHEAQEDFGVMPAGLYSVEVDKAEVRATKKGDGHYVWLQFSVFGEKYANRKLFSQINIDNPSAKAVEIGLSQLSALGKAVNGGHDVKLSSVDQLLGAKLLVRVKVKDDRNEISGYLALGSAPASVPSAPQVTHYNAPKKEASVSSSGGSVPPWKR